MRLQDLLAERIVAFHAAIMDSCHRSLRPEQTDRMALGLRGNAVSMAKLQLALVALAGSGTPELAPDDAVEPPLPEPTGADPGLPEALQGEASWAEPPWAEPPPAPDQAEPTDRMSCGDALALFASRRLAPGESEREVWQWALRAGEDATQRYPVRASDRGHRDVNARPP